MVDQKLASFIASKVRKSAESARMNAGYNGEWGDRGACAMEEKLQYWLDGLAGNIPAEWVHYEKEMATESDPEYEEYRRLQAKFGGK